MKINYYNITRDLEENYGFRMHPRDIRGFLSAFPELHNSIKNYGFTECNRGTFLNLLAKEVCGREWPSDSEWSEMSRNARLCFLYNFSSESRMCGAVFLEERLDSIIENNAPILSL